MQKLILQASVAFLCLTSSLYVCAQSECPHYFKSPAVRLLFGRNDHQKLAQRVYDEISAKTQGRFDYSKIGWQFALMNERNEPMALFDYTLSDNKKTITDILVVVEEQYQRQGLAKLLYSKMILDQPQVNKIESTLLWTNLIVAASALDDGATVKEAIMQTPYYKIFSQLGFSTISFSRLNTAGSHGVLHSLDVSLKR